MIMATAEIKMHQQLILMKKNIAVIGLGYVGLSLAILLAQNHHVIAVDISEEKVASVNSRKSPIKDDFIEKYFAEKELDLTAVTDNAANFYNVDFVISSSKFSSVVGVDNLNSYYDVSLKEIGNLNAVILPINF